MAFSDEDLESLADDFLARADSQIIAPRQHERMHGGNAGFSAFTRGIDKPPEAVATRKCRRCKQMVNDGKSLCVRHRVAHRRESLDRARRKGGKEWRPGGKGRPPDVVRSRHDAEVMLRESMLADAESELKALTFRIAGLKRELTVARREAIKGGKR